MIKRIRKILTSSLGPRVIDALIEGDTESRKGGSNYKDIIGKHGPPDSEIESTSGDYEIKKSPMSHSVLILDIVLGLS